MSLRTTISVFQGLLAFGGACIAGYSFIEKRQTGDVPCLVSGYTGCTAINNSAYSHIGPLDLSLLGAAAYIAILLLVVIKATADKPSFVKWPTVLIAAMTTFGVTYSWWLQYVAKYILNGFCINCRLSAITMTLLFFLAIIEVNFMRLDKATQPTAESGYDPSI
ncbi:MAG TPA: vitamin K epoxide reductase family protein [Capsulimonadaceae bacterium]|jgi:uncharacterized membrane protein